MPMNAQLQPLRALLSWRPLLFSLMTLALAGCGQEPSPSQSQQPAGAPGKVSVISLEPTDVTQVGTYPARLRSPGRVDVRAQVGGILQQRLYAEGALIEKGDALFQIDPEPYRLALARAEADLAEARANRVQAERDLRRVRELFQRRVVSEDASDTAEKAMQVAEAQLKRAQSSVNDAQRMLRYSQVQAPVTGISRLQSVAEGNLVEPGTLLTTLLPLDPIELHFTLPAGDARLRRGGDPADNTVTLVLDDRIYEHPGQLDFTASHINPETDSIQLRAVFPNPDGELLPGQFARVQIPLRTFADVFVIDPRAVSEGPLGPQVFTVNGDNRAVARGVKLGPVLDEGQIVLSGLEAKDQLVINGHAALRNDRPVAIVTRQEAPF